MSLKTRIREYLIKISGYWIYKKKDLYVGCDLLIDLKYKINLPLKTIFDVGANIGQTANLFNNNFKESNIYAFEPISKTYNMLIKNTKNMSRVQCYNNALGDKKSVISVILHEQSNSVFNSLKTENMYKEGNYSEEINVIKGDDFCSENYIEEIDLLKIDTEGYELEILNGFKDMIMQNKIKFIYCEVGFHPENKRNSYFVDLYTFAINNNFKFYGLYEISTLSNKSSQNFGNALFVHRSIY